MLFCSDTLLLAEFRYKFDEEFISRGRPKSSLNDTYEASPD